MSFWSQKKVLVTGGGGFLGHHVVDALKKTEVSQIIVPRKSQYDLTDIVQVKKLFKDYPCDALIHLAGHVGGLGKNAQEPATFFYKNIMINTLVIEEARLAGVQKIVTTGAGCGYPETAPLPLKETDFWNGFPQLESSPYSLAKRMLDVQAYAYWTQYQLPIIVLLPGNIYGPFDNFDLEGAHVAPALVRKFVEAVDRKQDTVIVWGNGQPTRDFVYAGDVAEGIVSAGNNLDRPSLINLASGYETSILEMVTALTTITGFTGKISWDSDRVSGQSRRYFDISRAKELLGYEPRTSLYDGLKQTVDWYRANKRTARNVFDQPNL
jgi:GDP-L-fucose synthase